MSATPIYRFQAPKTGYDMILRWSRDRQTWTVEPYLPSAVRVEQEAMSHAVSSVGVNTKDAKAFLSETFGVVWTDES